MSTKCLLIKALQTRRYRKQLPRRRSREDSSTAAKAGLWCFSLVASGKWEDKEPRYERADANTSDDIPTAMMRRRPHGLEFQWMNFLYSFLEITYPEATIHIWALVYCKKISLLLSFHTKSNFHFLIFLNLKTLYILKIANVKYCHAFPLILIKCN